MVKLNAQFITLSPEQRILSSAIPIIALTGGIASGKSSVSSFLKTHGIKIVCADSIIKDIYDQGQTFDFIRKLAPKAIKKNKIDFKQLRELFFTTPKLKNQIEFFLFKQYPHFLQKEFEKSNSQKFIFYDIPLLFEKKLNTQVDQSICVYTTKAIQISRIQQRDSCSKFVAKQIISQQLPMDVKREYANYTIVNTEMQNDLKQECEKFFNFFFTTD
jgi:dephospho-CoA kinase